MLILQPSRLWYSRNFYGRYTYCDLKVDVLRAFEESQINCSDVGVEIGDKRVSFGHRLMLSDRDE